MAGKQSIEIGKEEYEALFGFRYALRRFLRFSEQGARAAGLTPQQHQLLLAVKGQPGRTWASISDLAEALQIRHHAAVGMVDRCERAQLVRRAPHPGDRRQVRVTLTEKGETLLTRLSARNLRELRALQDALSLAFLETLTLDGDKPRAGRKRLKAPTAPEPRASGVGSVATVPEASE
jgi:DNA-binding MarR family transcriptional regulator